MFIAGNTNKVFIEIGHVFGQFFHCVTLWVQRNHHNLQLLFLAVFHFAVHVVKYCQGGRTNIRTVSKAKEYNGPDILHTGNIKGFAPMIDQLEVAKDSWFIQNNGTIHPQLLIIHNHRLAHTPHKAIYH